MLSEVGRREQAPTAATEAADLYRERAQTYPDAFGGRAGSAVWLVAGLTAVFGDVGGGMALVQAGDPHDAGAVARFWMKTPNWLGSILVLEAVADRLFHPDALAAIQAEPDKSTRNQHTAILELRNDYRSSRRR